MAKINVNQHVIKKMEDAASGKPIRENKLFEVFPISGKIFDHMSIILLKEGKDLPKNEMPNNTLYIPVNIKGREGYITDIKTAITICEKLS